MAIIMVVKQDNLNIIEEVCAFNKNSEIDNLLYFVTSGWAFRIPSEEDRKLWNSLIDEKWTELDDSDYFRYDKPFVFNNRWLSENNGHFVPVQEVINECKDIIKMLTKVKNLYGGRY